MISIQKNEIRTAVFHAAVTGNKDVNWSSLPQIVDRISDMIVIPGCKDMSELRDAVDDGVHKAFISLPYAKSAFNEVEFRTSIVSVLSAISFARELKQRGGI
jgi:hypothetical protein